MSQPNKLLGARPADLPITASIWDTAGRFDLNGQTVVIAMYHAIRDLESELIELKNRQS